MATAMQARGDGESDIFGSVGFARMLCGVEYGYRQVGSDQFDKLPLPEPDSGVDNFVYSLRRANHSFGNHRYGDDSGRSRSESTQGDWQKGAK